MIKKEKIKISVLGISMLTPMILTGCTQSDSSDFKSENREEIKTNISEEVVAIDEKKIIAEDDSENDLAGTCPKGLHCGAPGRCGLFMDGNDNNLCDRGE